MKMIETRGLCKSFGDHRVLDGIDLNVASGTIFALLGPNGAGKTTTVHILSTLIGADSGEARVAGHDVVRELDAVREAIGVTGQVSDRIAVLDQGKLVAEGTPDELKRRIPGGHISLQFADVSGLELAAHTLGEVVRNDNELTLQVPTDGSARSLKLVLDQLDHAAITVDGVSLHTPDLDDVFFALTSHPETQKGSVR